MIATNDFRIQVAKQTARGIYPANPTYGLRVLDGGLSSKPTLDTKNIADGSIWTPSIKRIGYIESGGQPTFTVDPISAGLLLTAGMGTDTPAGGSDPYSHVITPATSMSGFPYLTFWQEFDGEWSVFHDCQIVGFELACSTDNKFMTIQPTIIGMAKEQKCGKPTPAAAETDLYHWLDAGGYWVLAGDPANLMHADVTAIDLEAECVSYLDDFKTKFNAHCAATTGMAAQHHKAADAANTLGYGACTNLAGCYTALTEIRAKLPLHAANASAHYFAETITPSANWVEPCTSLAEAIAAIQELEGYVNAPGLYPLHLGARPCLRSFKLTLGMDAKGLQGEDMVACTVHRGKGTISVAAEQYMSDFRTYNLVKWGDPAAAAGTYITDDVQSGSIYVKFITEPVGGKERSLAISVPKFEFNPEPIMSTFGNPEGGEIYLTLGGDAVAAVPATVTLLNGVSAY